MRWRVTPPQLVITQAAAAEQAADAVTAVTNDGQAPWEKCRPQAAWWLPPGHSEHPDWTAAADRLADFIPVRNRSGGVSDGRALSRRLPSVTARAVCQIKTLPGQRM